MGRRETIRARKGARPTRRFLLDRLFARDGRTLTELESELEMTRFGVMKHLRVLEDAGARRRTGTNGMTTMTETDVTTQAYRVFIKATPEAIWEAITDPDFNERYGYRGRKEYDLRPGGAFSWVASPEMQARGRPEHLLDGEVVEVDPPNRLVQTWRALWDPAMTAEGFTRVPWEIEAGDAGIATLTVTHELAGAPQVAATAAGEVPGAGGGWSWILSDLKTLLETGAPLAS